VEKLDLEESGETDGPSIFLQTFSPKSSLLLPNFSEFLVIVNENTDK